jgi:hypothetical protein
MVGITGGFGHFFGKIKVPGAGNTNVNLLQKYNVSLVVREHLGNSIGLETTVHTDGPVHIVRKDPDPHI